MNGAQVERDLAEVLELGADFAVLDAGSSTIRALAQATRYLEQVGKSGRLALIVAGELSLPQDFIKALALGADGIVVASSVVAAITKLVTPELAALTLLSNFIANATTLMRTMARACGHDHLTQFSPDDLTTWLYDVAVASGVRYSGQTLAE
jgi:glutamate synthase domain-containing protein 2